MESNFLVILHVLYFFISSFLGIFLALFLIFSLFSIYIDMNYYFNNDVYSILKDCFNLSLRGAFLLSLVPFLKAVLYLCKRGGNG
ncbi:hypothetical protein NYR79_04810 [Actinobacillus equuli subsp. haemolyticus]|uniref:hypothetical protein n=1 Tax=Actinobacillus equuli TaxID=718 RepID=UPI0024433AED|nr:hypothetical protein [Actinobacillus equuli]WGE72190.1 hypothetical protein NYR79_04810 [Actinobacillus equuli subsp. haemolyticus]